MSSLTLYPSQMDTTNSSYYAISSNYPASAIVGKGSNNGAYGVGINLTRNSGGVTNAYFNFDFSSIPSGVSIQSIYCKAAVYGSTSLWSRISSAYLTQTVNLSEVSGRTSFSGSTSSNTTEYPELTYSGSINRNDLDSFKVLIKATRNSSGATSNTYMYIRGIDLVVTYFDTVTHTLTITSNGYSVIPSESGEYAEDSTVDIEVDEDTMPKATLDGVDITDQFEKKSRSASGDISVYPAASSYTGISSGTNYIAYAVGRSAENPYSSTNNYYGSSSATVDSQYAQYTFDLSGVPESAEDISVSCTVAGKAETTTYTHQSGGRYSVWGLCSNGVAKGDQIYTTSTSVTTMPFTNTGSWTRSELDNLQLRHYVGYYGGATLGATLSVSYKMPGSGTYFYYELNMGTSDKILVFSAGGTQAQLMVKSGGTFSKVVALYKKVNNRWVLQSDIEDIFTEYSSGDATKYIRR